MPRIHKYRAFIDGQMVYFQPLTLTRDRQHIAGNGTGDFWIDDYFGEEPADLMQWMGLVDKNGRDIYERDVCKVSGGWSGDSIQPMYDLGSFHFWDEVTKNLEAGATYEVIGNTLEHPTILEVNV